MSGTRGGGGSNAVNGKGNSGNSNGGAGGGGVVGSIPQASKKMVQSLKEIVNCPEVEIYAMLKECNMDPNEAVNRLLSQDPFHRVKSKREKKKENKDATDSRSRGNSINLNRGGRGGSDRYGRAILSQFSSSESGASRGKLSYKKDNGATYTISSSGPGVVGNNISQRPPAVSETTAENKALTFNIDEGVPSLHPSPAFQSSWSGVPGQVSMADIVKMGRPHGRGPSNVNSSHHSTSHHHVAASHYAPTPHELRSSQNYGVKVSEVNLDLGVDGNQSVSANDEWPQVEQPPTVSLPLMSEPAVTSEQYKDPSSLPVDRTIHHLDEVQYAEDAEADARHAKTQEQSSDSALVHNNELYDSINSYQVHRRAYEQQEVEDVGVSLSSVTTNINQLILSKEEEEEEEEVEEEEEDEEEEDDSFEEIDSPVVKIPDHLQIQSADCSHLSFGSFGSGMSAPFSGPFASGPPKGNIEETSTAGDAPSVGHTDARNSDSYEDEHIRTPSDGNSDHRLAVSSASYGMPSGSQSEALKQEAPDVVVAPGNEYSFPSSTNYTFENSQHLNPSFSHSQISSQMQNLPPLSGIMSYSNSLPSSLLPSNIHTARDAELPYSPFPIAQSMATKHSGGGAASINGPTISMAEALKTGNFSSPQPAQNLPGSSISGGPNPVFPQHLPVHPYSQLSLPFPNMIGYHLLPQSYTYPSAFQQAIAAAGNNTYHQPLSAGVLPQYKNSVSASSLPQSATGPTGYGAFGSSSSVPGNFSLNPAPAAAPPSATSMSYDDLLSSQYKDAAQMLALQQNESSPLWVQGPGSRTMSAVPASTYYSFQGQSQQPAGYRQSQQQQQPSQHYGTLGGYPNFYHSQSGVPPEHQQQISRDGSLGAAQGQQQPKQPQQIWQNSY